MKKVMIYIFVLSTLMIFCLPYNESIHAKNMTRYEPQIIDNSYAVNIVDINSRKTINVGSFGIVEFYIEITGEIKRYQNNQIVPDVLIRITNVRYTTSISDYIMNCSATYSKTISTTNNSCTVIVVVTAKMFNNQLGEQKKTERYIYNL